MNNEITAVLEFSKKEIMELLNNIKEDDMLHLVGDQGVYLMSFAEKDVNNRTIVYAKGINPNKDDAWYENKRYTWGGDDGGEDVGTKKVFLQRLEMSKGNTYKIGLSPTNIYFLNE